MRKMSFNNQERNKSELETLTNALANRRQPIGGGRVTLSNPYSAPKSSEDSGLSDGIGGLLSGGLSLYKGIKDSGLFDGSSETVPEQYKFLSNSSFGSAPSDGTLFGGYDLGGANAGQGALQTSEMPTFNGFGGAETGAAETAGGSFLGNIAPYGGLIMGGLRAGTKGLSGGDLETDVPQAFFGVNEDSSDIMQGLNGAINGAIMGAPFGGPIGATIGGLLGLGSSFLDDI